MYNSGIPFGETLSDQIALSDVGIEKNCLKIGDCYFKFVSLYNLPEGVTYAGMVNSLLQLPFHFWISQNISVLDQAKEIEKLKIQRRLANSFAQGSEKISDIESESKLSQTQELLEELLEGNDRVVSSSLVVIVWDKDREIAEEKSDAVLWRFREMNQAEGIKEDYASLEVFLNNL